MRFIMRGGLAFGIASPLMLGLVGAHSPRSQDQQEPTFRATTTLVEVSAVITRDGLPVTDIQQADVRVFDNGVEQPLVAFEYVDLTTSEGGAQRRDFVLVVDDWHIDPTRTKPTHEFALRFIDALGPYDRLAIVNTGPHELVQQLSTDRDPARALIRRVRGQQVSIIPGEHEMKARIALEVLKRVATALATDAAERRAVVVVSEGHPGFGEGPVDTPEGALVRATYGEVLQAAAFANVAVYGVDPRGLEAPNTGAPQSAGAGRTWQNRALAAAAASQGASVAGAMLGRYYGAIGLLALHTGGVLTVDTNDLGKHIPRILQDSRQYYRLAYAQPEPELGKAQPRSRHIDVKVARSGVDVRARQQYTPR